MSHRLIYTARSSALTLLACLMAACGGGGGGGGGASSSPNAVAPSPTSTSSAAASTQSSTSSATASLMTSVSSAASSTANIATPLALSVPTLAYDDTSIVLVWKKPASYANIVDYNVYMNGSKLGSAAANNTGNSPAKAYIDAFYAADTANFHTKLRFHNFTVSGLSPSTTYSFTVRALDASGNESADSIAVQQKTAPNFTNIINITSSGAATSNTAATNTTAIQSAIDNCAASSSSAYGCKVLVPSGTFLTGALFLKSNMTLELASGATLKASSSSTDFPLSKGYQLYSFFTNSNDDRRPPSLLNLLNPAHLNGSKALSDHQGYDETRGVFSNVRIVGKGTLDGNGWANTGTLTDEAGKALQQYYKGSSSSLSTLLAKSQVSAGTTELGSSALADVYSNRRSSLTTFRGVNGLYFGGLTLLNPAFHGVMFLESQNLVFAFNNTQTYAVNNGDGVEFGNSDGVTVFSNFFDCGDDNINFAAGQGSNYADSASAHPMQNAWIFNNYMRMGHGGVVAGSHTGAWIQDILAEDNVMNKTEVGLRMKSTPATGGGARRITFRDNAMKDIAKNAFIFTLAYSAGSNSFTKAAAAAKFYDFTIQNTSVDGSASAAIAVDAYDGSDSTLGYAATFQESLNFDSVKFNNAAAVSIDRLKNSAFKNVSVTNSGSSFWSAYTNASNNSFSNVSQKSDGTN